MTSFQCTVRQAQLKGCFATFNCSKTVPIGVLSGKSNKGHKGQRFNSTYRSITVLQYLANT